MEVGGEVWTVLWWQFTCSDEYQTRSGRWIREPDPRVRDYVLNRLEWARGLHWEGVPARDQQHWIDHYTWVLERNGWEVPPGCPLELEPPCVVPTCVRRRVGDLQLGTGTLQQRMLVTSLRSCSERRNHRPVANGMPRAKGPGMKSQTDNILTGFVLAISLGPTVAALAWHALQ